MVCVDLLKAVEQSWKEGKIHRFINSTFLNLIPKCENPKSYANFRLISLCNLFYKLITKIISNRLKPILARFISIEQFGFLKRRQILDPVGISQEIIHNIKTKKLEALVLKLDLLKEVDRVNWTFLCLLLLQVCLTLETVKWIMGCISSKNFSMLINGSP